MQAISISDSENVKALRDLVESSKCVIKTELAFVVTVMQPLHVAIITLQKESGGILDAMGTFNTLLNGPSDAFTPSG